MTDHELLVELLDGVMPLPDNDITYGDIEKMLARLRSNGPDGVRVVPFDKWCVDEVAKVGQVTIGNTTDIGTTLWNHIVRMLRAAGGERDEG